MERHQNVRSRMPWLTGADQLLALLFISHRWKTLKHPDPNGADLSVVQHCLRRVCDCIEAMLVARDERLRLVPSLAYEGTLQAEEVARRMLGFGPFGATASVDGAEARRIVRERFRLHSGDRPAFRDWLLGSIGVWLDYTCMPQKPLTPEEEREFREALASLDSLVMSSTVVALRRPGDDYSARGWCASEFFLGSKRSFSRSIFIDADRMEKSESVAIAAASIPEGGASTELIQQSYKQDRAAFEDACNEWSSFEGPLVDLTPPAPWSAYRDLQGSSLFQVEYDPNPLRRALEVVRGIETSLIEKWLMADQPWTLDLGVAIAEALDRLGLECSDPADRPYLGLVLACHGWIDAFRPLFRACLGRFVESPPRFMSVTLEPLAAEVRALFRQVTPVSAISWNLRLATGAGHDLREKRIVARIRESLAREPPQFGFTRS